MPYEVTSLGQPRAATVDQSIAQPGMSTTSFCSLAIFYTFCSHNRNQGAKTRSAFVQFVHHIWDLILCLFPLPTCSVRFHVCSFLTPHETNLDDQEQL